MDARKPWTAADALYSHGLTARPHTEFDLVIADDEGEVAVDVKELLRAPRTQQIEKSWLARPGTVQLYIVPSITPSIFRLGAQYPFIAFIGKYDRGLIWRGEYRSLDAAPVDAGRRGRQPWVKWAVMRALLAPVARMNQTQLAHAVGTTQASVSNALKALGDLATRADGGWIATDPQQVWDRFLASYPGVGVARTHWLSLDPPVQQARTIAAAILETRPDAQVLFSGDIGADMVAAWRVPTRSAVYSDIAINPENLGFAAAAGEESTLEFVMPHDPTVWATARLFSGHPAADPLIIASELQLNRAIEVDEARAHLKDQTIERLQRVRR